MVSDGLEIVMAQLALLNLGLNTERVGVQSQVVYSKVVPPPEYFDPNIEEGTLRSD